MFEDPYGPLVRTEVSLKNHFSDSSLDHRQFRTPTLHPQIY